MTSEKSDVSESVHCAPIADDQRPCGALLSTMSLSSSGVEEDLEPHSTGVCTFGSHGSGSGETGRSPARGPPYWDYIEVDRVLNGDVLLSEQAGAPAHDEHLFKLIHQVYELWFKQLLFEIDSIRDIMCQHVVSEHNMLKVVSRMQRVVQIEKLIIEQILVLETMSALDFLEFRDFLTPASGFQSLQFRLLENKIGMLTGHRVQYNRESYQSVFTRDKDQQLIAKSLSEPSLLEIINTWLERTPGLEATDFNFVARYRTSVERFVGDKFIDAQGYSDPEVKRSELDKCEKLRAAYETVTDAAKYNEFRRRGDRRLSHQAMMGAVMIAMYRDEPRFNQPFQLLTLLVDMDSLLTKWRYNHSQMVQRMIGTKIGTGGSSGYHYLRSTGQEERYDEEEKEIDDRGIVKMGLPKCEAFIDLFNISTFCVPRSYMPRLSRVMTRRLSIADVGRARSPAGIPERGRKLDDTFDESSSRSSSSSSSSTE